MQVCWCVVRSMVDNSIQLDIWYDSPHAFEAKESEEELKRSWREGGFKLGRFEPVFNIWMCTSALSCTCVCGGAYTLFDKQTLCNRVHSQSGGVQRWRTAMCEFWWCDVFRCRGRIWTERQKTELNIKIAHAKTHKQWSWWYRFQYSWKS